MNIKRTSNSSSYQKVSSSAPSRTYATSQVSSVSEASSTQASSSVTGDIVNVSTEGLLRTEAYKVAMSTADIRQQKINEIKNKIANGTYVIDTKKLAFNLLQDETVLL